MKKIYLLIFSLLSIALVSKAQCPAGQTEISIEINAISFGSEVGWELVDATTNTVIACAPAGTYTDGDVVLEGPFCVVNGNTINLVGYDDFGDDWNGGFANIIITEDGSVNGCGTQDGCTLLANAGEFLDIEPDVSVTNSCETSFEEFTVTLPATDCITPIMGCTDPSAGNFNACATIDDGSCVLPAPGQDCLAAAQLCCSAPLPAPMAGVGNIDEVIPNDCGVSEDNSTWAVISVTTAGTISMNFDAMPDADIDFTAWLFDGTPAAPATLADACGDLSANNGMRCDFDGSGTESGFGIACGGGGGCDPDGDFNVTVGDLIVVMVNDFGTFNGFTFDADIQFGGGATAGCAPPTVSVTNAACSDDCGANTGSPTGGSIAVTNCPPAATSFEHSTMAMGPWTTGLPPVTTAFTGFVRCVSPDQSCISFGAPITIAPATCTSCGCASTCADVATDDCGNDQYDQGDQAPGAHALGVFGGDGTGTGCQTFDSDPLNAPFTSLPADAAQSYTFCTTWTPTLPDAAFPTFNGFVTAGPPACFPTQTITVFDNTCTDVTTLAMPLTVTQPDGATNAAGTVAGLTIGDTYNVCQTLDFSAGFDLVGGVACTPDASQTLAQICVDVVESGTPPCDALVEPTAVNACSGAAFMVDIDMGNCSTWDQFDDPNVAGGLSGFGLVYFSSDGTTDITTFTDIPAGSTGSDLILPAPPVGDPDFIFFGEVNAGGCADIPGNGFTNQTCAPITFQVGIVPMDVNGFFVETGGESCNIAVTTLTIWPSFAISEIFGTCGSPSTVNVTSGATTCFTDMSPVTLAAPADPCDPPNTDSWMYTVTAADLGVAGAPAACLPAFSGTINASCQMGSCCPTIDPPVTMNLTICEDEETTLALPSSCLELVTPAAAGLTTLTMNEAWLNVGPDAVVFSTECNTDGSQAAVFGLPQPDGDTQTDHEIQLPLSIPYCPGGYEVCFDYAESTCTGGSTGPEGNEPFTVAILDAGLTVLGSASTVLGAGDEGTPFCLAVIMTNPNPVLCMDDMVTVSVSTSTCIGGECGGADRYAIDNITFNCEAGDTDPAICWFADDGTGNPDLSTIIFQAADPSAIPPVAPGTNNDGTADAVSGLPFDPIATGDVDPNTAGVYSVFAQCKNCGCESMTQEVTVTVLERPLAFDYPNTCVGPDPTMAADIAYPGPAQTLTGTFSFSIDGGTGATIDGTTGAIDLTAMVCGGAPATYEVSFTPDAPNAACVETDNVIITPPACAPDPTANLVVCAGDATAIMTGITATCAACPLGASTPFTDVTAAGSVDTPPDGVQDANEVLNSGPLSGPIFFGALGPVTFTASPTVPANSVILDAIITINSADGTTAESVDFDEWGIIASWDGGANFSLLDNGTAAGGAPNWATAVAGVPFSGDFNALNDYTNTPGAMCSAAVGDVCNADGTVSVGAGLTCAGGIMDFMQTPLGGSYDVIVAVFDPFFEDGNPGDPQGQANLDVSIEFIYDTYVPCIDCTSAASSCVAGGVVPPPSVVWYDMSTGGTSQGSGDAMHPLNTFDPTGTTAEEGAFDINTAGVYTYYAECVCNDCPSLRTPATVTVVGYSNITVNQDCDLTTNPPTHDYTLELCFDVDQAGPTGTFDVTVGGVNVGTFMYSALTGGATANCITLTDASFDAADEAVGVIVNILDTDAGGGTCGTIMYDEELCCVADAGVVSTDAMNYCSDIDVIITSDLSAAVPNPHDAPLDVFYTYEYILVDAAGNIVDVLGPVTGLPGTMPTFTIPGGTLAQDAYTIIGYSWLTAGGPMPAPVIGDVLTTWQTAAGFDALMNIFTTGCGALSTTPAMINVYDCDLSSGNPLDGSDPCSCLDNASPMIVQSNGTITGGDDGGFTERIAIFNGGAAAASMLPAGLCFSVISNLQADGLTPDGGFGDGTTAGLPAVGAPNPAAPIGTGPGDACNVVEYDDLGDADPATGFYFIDFVHIDGLGFDITVEGPNNPGMAGNTTLNFVNTCHYPVPTNPLPVGPYCTSVPPYIGTLSAITGSLGVGVPVPVNFISAIIVDTATGATVEGPDTDGDILFDFAALGVGTFQLIITVDQTPDDPPCVDCAPGCQQVLIHEFENVEDCISVGIPTASEWGLLCLGLSLLSLVTIYVRRKEEEYSASFD